MPIPPITNTGRHSRSRAIRLCPVVKIGIGAGRRVIAPNRGEFTPFRPWNSASNPCFTRTSGRIQRIKIKIERIIEPPVAILENITERVVVIAYLPHVKEEDIHIELHGDVLEISAQAENEFGPQKYAREMLLPFMADPKTIKSSFNNGILAIRLSRMTQEFKKAAVG